MRKIHFNIILWTIGWTIGVICLIFLGYQTDWIVPVIIVICSIIIALLERLIKSIYNKLKD